MAEEKEQPKKAQATEADKPPEENLTEEEQNNCMDLSQVLGDSW